MSTLRDSPIVRPWVPDILLALSDGPKRFNRILEIPRISDRILTERLRELEVVGLVGRIVDPGPPVAVSYRLTAAGQRYLPALQQLQAIETPGPQEQIA